MGSAATKSEEKKRKVLAFLVLLLVFWWRNQNDKRCRAKCVKYGPLLQRDIWRTSELIRLIDASDRICIRELRMSRPVFYKLCARLRDKGLLVDTFHVSVEEQVAVFLKIVGQYHTQSSVVVALWRSGWAVSKYFNVVLRAIMKLAPELIYVRSTSTHPKITNSPNIFYPYFEGCIGALDGTHVRACVPAKSVDRFRGRKSYPTQNILAVVDFDLRFTYFLSGWEGSAHNSLVLQDAFSCPNGLKIPESPKKRKFYLADAGYATRPGILPPYRGGAHDPKCPKELFNHRHSQLRTTVERAFGALKNRFKILSNKPFVPLKSQAKVVIACCALHNWILDDGPDEFIYDEPTWYDHLPRSKNRVSDREADVREWTAKRDWYIDYQKDKPATFGWKQQHHHQCAEALNARFGIGTNRNQVHRHCRQFKRFGIGTNRNQVHRHCRQFKEKWNWIKEALGKSGNGFDAAACKFNIPYFEKSPSKLGTAKYNYLTRPIKFFGLMKELFGASVKANGSLAIDQSTLDAEDGTDESGSDQSFTAEYGEAEHGENNSDTIAGSRTLLFGSISSMKRKNMKVSVKKHTKDKAKRARPLKDDEIAASIVMLANSIASSGAAPTDPYKRIEDIPFPPRDKVDIAAHLSKPEQVYLCNYLNAASDESFGTWVIDYLGDKYGDSIGYGAEYGSSVFLFRVHLLSSPPLHDQGPRSKCAPPAVFLFLAPDPTSILFLALDPAGLLPRRRVTVVTVLSRGGATGDHGGSTGGVVLRGLLLPRRPRPAALPRAADPAALLFLAPDPAGLFPRAAGSSPQRRGRPVALARAPASYCGGAAASSCCGLDRRRGHVLPQWLLPSGGGSGGRGPARLRAPSLPREGLPAE
ncbi:hypothetical protein U9M48_030701 [Paspalum notatum var. saurae]|uniref:DDE Tnp4 domain-containing protein n=1 Tax=Paspalum notatum var. saurae TaxID=547442 RepID=A0AAQ3U215_PASNO